jgi:hypothetical protein
VQKKVSAAVWKWGTKYSAEYVNILYRSIKRNLPLNYELQFICITEDHAGLDHNIRFLPLYLLPKKVTEYLYVLDGCYARLVIFDPMFSGYLQEAGIEPPDRLTVFDLDAVVCGPMEAIFLRQEPFIIAQGIHYLKTAFNGSLVQLKLGYRPDVWTEFSVEKARPLTMLPDQTGALVYQSTDQSWLYHMFKQRAAQFTPRGSGVYGYGKPGWPEGSAQIPPNARVIFFPGRRDPADPELQKKLPWIKDHWRV